MSGGHLPIGDGKGDSLEVRCLGYTPLLVKSLSALDIPRISANWVPRCGSNFASASSPRAGCVAVAIAAIFTVCDSYSDITFNLLTRCQTVVVFTTVDSHTRRFVRT